MINSKEELKEYLAIERPLYIDGGKMTSLKLWLLQDSSYLLWHYMKMLRYTEYFFNTGKSLLYYLYERRKNREGARLGISIFQNSVGKGLLIYHYGSIIINANANVGDFCKLHGNNCIGNKGDHDKMHAPTIGDHAEFGVGACVLGNITLGNNITVAANAVVVKDCRQDNVMLTGVPASIKTSDKRTTF